MKCQNDSKSLNYGDKCENEVPKGFFSQSRHLTDGKVEISFCSPMCRSEYKLIHNIEVYDRKA